jgi:transcriptional regulator with XRE-family HTH domain
MELAAFIAQARDRKGLSFRDLEKRADDLDHAYIWRLEKGEKGAPSVQVLQKLGAALQLDEREQQILGVLGQNPIEDALYKLMLDRRDMAWENFETAASMSFRGSRPSTEESWLKLIEMIRDI